MMATTTTTIIPIAALNAEAVQFMLEAQYDHATTILRHALNVVRSDLLLHRDDTTDTETTFQPITVINDTPAELLTIRPISVRTTLDDKARLYSENDDAYVLCSQAFLCHSTTTEMHSEGWIHSQATLSAVLFYNLALCIHLQSLAVSVETGNKEKKMQCSLRIYNMALEVVSKEGVVAQQKVHLLPLILAAVNNKGHLCSRLFYHEEFHHCLHDMQRLLEYYSETTNDSNDRRRSKGGYYECDHRDMDSGSCCQLFRLNLLVFQNSSSSPSAPAA